MLSSAFKSVILTSLITIFLSWKLFMFSVFISLTTEVVTAPKLSQTCHFFVKRNIFCHWPRCIFQTLYISCPFLVKYNRCLCQNYVTCQELVLSPVYTICFSHRSDLWVWLIGQKTHRTCLYTLCDYLIGFSIFGVVFRRYLHANLHNVPLEGR